MNVPLIFPIQLLDIDVLLANPKNTDIKIVFVNIKFKVIMSKFIPQGVITAIVTPFKSNLDIDFDAFERLIEYQIERQVDGIVVCGSTGESATLSHKERIALIIKAIQIAMVEFQLLQARAQTILRLQLNYRP